MASKFAFKMGQLVPLQPGAPRRGPRGGGARRTLTPHDPQLKGAWYPGGFNPCVYRVKNGFQNVPLQMQLAPIHRAAREGG
jgi:hypothetical protein